MIRHFTATAFVVRDGETLLHWHRKLGQWMPPGGHLLPDEDPVTGVLREVREETGLDVELIDATPRFAFDYPEQLPAPFTILIEDITEPDGSTHQHIDLIYFTRARDGDQPSGAATDDILLWVTEDQLSKDEPLLRGEGGASANVPEDVRTLALEAIRAEREPSR
jgi:8-oxo-dGTP pyrophosphatase MutT (NUDIX family)